MAVIIERGEVRRLARVRRSNRGRGSGEWIRRWGVLAVLAVALTIAAFPPLAHADGDPASDYLVARQVFLSSQSTSPSASQRELLGVVAAASRAGFAIRVAIISSDYDLGSITALWRKPRLYARFLGLELSLTSKQRLLVVMPNGFGFNWPHHSAGPAYRLLAKIPIPSGATGSLDAAETAVRQLAAAAGVTIPALTNSRTNEAAPVRAGGNDPVAIIAAALAALAAGLGVLFARGRRRRDGLDSVSEPSAAGRSGWPITRRWALPGFGSRGRRDGRLPCRRSSSRRAPAFGVPA
jgi:hypothetical protein